VNWLNTSSGFQPAYKFTTQPGDMGYNANENISLWTMADAGFDAANFVTATCHDHVRIVDGLSFD
jgi:hypothetical protein